MAISSIIFQSLKSPENAALLLLLSITIYLGSIAVYNLYFHPLAKFPGPKWHAISHLAYCHKLIRGTWPFDVLLLHEKYGDVVRVAPNELAFSTPEAWKDIAGHRTGGGEELSKYEGFYKINPIEASNIVTASREEHGKLRRELAHGFSEKSMREQEPMIGKYIDLLIQRLHENCIKGPVNLGAWYNFTTFDVIGDLAFGEPFGCLESSEYHPWVKMILESARLGTVLQATYYFPILKFLLLLVPISIKESSMRAREAAHQKVAKRIEKGSRPDLINGLLYSKQSLGLSIEQLAENANTLVIAGSETTATLLSGATFHILTNPDVLAKLTAEVRSTFASDDEIDIISVGGLKYMLACLDEALRMYPPVPIGLPRITGKAGATVSGEYLPADTVVAVYQWASYHRSKYFSKPMEFHPERFLGAEEFAHDNREMLQPFSVGPRNCLGRNLAYAESRLILARMVFNFDMRIADESKDWNHAQKIYFLWHKGPLMVYLTPVNKDVNRHA
ncbi:cytochrome P450 [Pseudovirgaria hyperparasitica]|uniref:Cytochrome P450 n=1 Tax=Pseudovirgaria hyperparasitica TaxID=470096 RepID=A0A6A6WC24_9PEZI|nr:cytochrome P450 [Pseudovirgaria hyperparasitica]KAF2760253.1 cytochrome P450 [Pseudovirgaria hyperparasitica]